MYYLAFVLLSLNPSTKANQVFIVLTFLLFLILCRENKDFRVYSTYIPTSVIADNFCEVLVMDFQQAEQFSLTNQVNS